MNKQMMLDAYSMLFDIETSLKDYISNQLINFYGHNWKSQLHEDRVPRNCHFHELIAFLGKYPHLFPQFDLSKRKQLYQLNDIRNKVCHMQPLTFNELDYLKECHNNIVYSISSLF